MQTGHRYKHTNMLVSNCQDNTSHNRISAYRNSQKEFYTQNSK